MVKNKHILEEANALVESQSKITTATVRGTSKLERLEKELSEARRNLASSESKNLIDGVEPSSTPETKAYVELTLRRDRARTALGGITKMVANGDPVITETAARLKSERQAFNERAIATYCR